MKADLSKYEKQEKIDAYVSRMKEIIKSLKEKFDIVVQETEKILPINQIELASEADRNISKYHNYILKLKNEQRNLYTLKIQKDIVEGELHDYYRFTWDKSTKLSESAIQKYVYAHPIFTSLNEVLKEQESVVSYFESVVIAIRDRGFAIKSMIEVKKIELGMT